MNRFNRLDLVDRVPEELWREFRNTVQKVVTKIIPKNMKFRKAKWLSEDALQTAKKRSKRQRRMGKIRDVFKKTGDIKRYCAHFMQEWPQ